ncbi:GlxA family transcriptional regulator [Advenella mimigardefordensis]|uniref:Transcriptional regulator, AraC family n=1 Tax=Advenella mimigardefordensis (strain DSM 17166 / LMG 22922 / DPN7) TaxID=1247726 RepID=W0PJD1_ADVMD|nr:GlxA family transcriptional regulator [Advenella mimigardefordensis]AHG65103.1 transcriptional regulator, AraC family [Advenella mimigardefordensis DPN7]
MSRNRIIMYPPSKDTAPIRFGFLLLPHFTLTAFSGLLDILRLAGDEGDYSQPVRCTWHVIDETLAPVSSSSAIQVVPSEKLGDPSRFDYLVVVGGLLHTGLPLSAAQKRFIQQAADSNVNLVGVCTGVFALMQAGVMQDHRICVSWFHYWDFIEQFPHADPNLIVADRLYVCDRRRITCSGGRASIDVAADILKRHMDDAIVQKALRILQVDHSHSHTAPQPLPPGIAPDTPPVVRRAMLLMEQHMGQALTLDMLAGKLNISVRQLERLFKQSSGMSPQAYSRGVRLRMAAWMLTHSTKTIAAIASACGFADASHMGREFRGTFDMSPGQWRSRAQLPAALLATQTSDPIDYVSEVFPGRQDFH